MNARRLLIDADAIPRSALAIAEGLAKEKGWVCTTFASINHHYEGLHHVIVDAGPEAVDMKIANETKADDVVVTQDTGLAAMVLGKRAKALSPHGVIFRPEQITFQLEARNEKARFRRSGGRTKGPAARTGEDDERFERALRYVMGEGGDTE